jgi:hypothetical protein
MKVESVYHVDLPSEGASTAPSETSPRRLRGRSPRSERWARMGRR